MGGGGGVVVVVGALGSFDTMPSRLVFLISFSTPGCLKSLECKDYSPIRVLLETEVHNFAWEEDLKNKDGDITPLFGLT